MAVWSSFCFTLLCLLQLTHSGKRVVKEKGTTRHQAHDVELDAADVSHYTLEIQHSFGNGGEFTRRGVIHFKSLKSASSLTFQQVPLSHQLAGELKVAARNGEHYYIRAATNISCEEEDGHANFEPQILTFTSACAMVTSGLTDKIVVHGDGRGSVIALTLLPVLSDMNPNHLCSETDSLPSKSAFTSLVSYTTGETGPSPDTGSFLQKVEEEKQKKEGEDNRSFFQKYWLYIVIGIVAVQFLGPAITGGQSGQ